MLLVCRHLLHGQPRPFRLCTTWGNVLRELGTWVLHCEGGLLFDSTGLDEWDEYVLQCEQQQSLLPAGVSATNRAVVCRRP
jgi:hypothetical protein